MSSSESLGISQQKREYVTESDEQTIELGRELARAMRPPLLVLLVGKLGTGKTTLAKGIAAGMGAAREEDVTSPSFTLVHEYLRGPVPVFHVDLYRLEEAGEIATLGLEDLFADEHPAVVLIEWGERLRNLFPGRRWEIHLSDLGGDRRRITVEECDG
jgi:tRNA threonylcarbamoyladenosine biosynthesis protein TsaE